MQEPRPDFLSPRAFAYLAVALLLGGCLEGQPEDGGDGGPVIEVDLSGSVGDGPVVGATLTIRDNDDATVETLQSDAGADYRVLIAAPDSAYPLTIEASGGTDLVTNTAPDFTMLGALANPAARSVANVNPYSTLAVKLAIENNGGITRDSLEHAENVVVYAFNNGLTSLATTGPLSTPIDATNIAEIVRASEVLGETIRRTRDILAGAGRPTDGDAVVRILAADLVDGVVDGRGGAAAEPRLAAVANLVTAEVVLEAMHNELRVHGSDASQRMQQAIDQVSDEPAMPTLDDLASTASMIEVSRVGVAAAYAVTADPALANLATALAGLQPGMSGPLVGSVVPANYRTLLEVASVAAGNAGDTVVEAVNEIARTRDVSIDVPGNQVPVIAGTPAPVVTAGVAYRFAPDAGDADGDALTFSVSGLPAWAAFDAASGVLSGTPAASDVGVYSGITISVTDGIASASLPRFAIEVLPVEEEPPTPVNRPPVIGGSPPGEVVAGQPYAFRPSASDPDGDPLSFTVAGLPGWAAFNSTTGRITGTPGGGDVGEYSGIVISVSDGTASASLGPFSVSVVAAALGSVTLSWAPPTENTDGSALTDLAGYRLYWGPEENDYPNQVELDNPGLTSYVVENLAAGTYVFTMKSVNAAGTESDFATPVSATVP